MPELICTNCGRPYPDEGVPYRCTVCGGVFDYRGDFSFNSDHVETTDRSIWRYRALFDLPADAPVVTLGEGSTPLVTTEIAGKPIGFKLEYLNPTGSFKDRGSAPLVSMLLARRVTSAVEDSSGNAGASFAAYTAKAGIAARVFVPDYASGPKRAQIEAYGAKLTRILGPRSNASEAVRRAAQEGQIYASHAHQPFGLMGLATVAYEIVSQLGESPGTLIAPVGQGSLLLGAWRGFRAMKNAGAIPRVPRMVGVQAEACAPLWAVFSAGAAGLRWVTERQTVAEGVRIKTPIRGDAVLKAVEESNGLFLVVGEGDILNGQAELARLGFLVEPTSAIVWDGLQQVLDSAPEPIVVLLTGSGYKSL